MQLYSGDQEGTDGADDGERKVRVNAIYPLALLYLSLSLYLSLFLSLNSVQDSTPYFLMVNLVVCHTWLRL